LRYRHEKKYLINPHTTVLLRARVAAIMKPDENGGSYVINNMYLDDYFDSYYYFNAQGKFSRDKFRLRYYNGDKSFIRLERKHKDGIVAYKDSQRVTREQYQKMKEGDFEWLLKEESKLFKMLAVIYRLRGLKASTIYAYRREAYVYEPCNVRITFDSPLFQTDDTIREGIYYEPLKINYGYEPYFPILLEVKYCEFLPETIKRVLNGFPLAHTGMSKYCISRERGVLPYGKT